MSRFVRFVAAAALSFSFFAAPASALAQFDEAGFLIRSFGGQIVSINYCLHGAVNIIIKPAGLFDVSYVWSLPPATITLPPFIFPNHIGEQVLGLALPVPVPCVGFGTHPPVWYGWQVIYGGASLI